MALAKHTIRVLFEGGIETKQDRKTIPSVRLTDLQNCVFTKRGSLVKRNGYESLGNSVLSSTSPLPDGKGLATREGELLLFSDSKVHSYVESKSKWDDAGDVQPVKVSTSVIANTPGDQTLADSASNDGVSLYAWIDSAGGVYCSAVDSSSGRALIEPVQLDADGVRPRVAAVGNTLQVYWVNVAAKTIWSRVLLTSNPKELLGRKELVGDISSVKPCYDIDASGSEVVVAWVRDSLLMGIGYITKGGILGSAVSGYPSAISAFTVSGDGGIAIARDAGGDNRICIAWSSSGGSNASFVAADLASAGPTHGAIGLTSSKITLAFSAESNAAGEREVTLFNEVAGSNDQNYTVRYRSFDTGGAAGTSLTKRGVKLASKAFAEGGATYVHLVRETTFFRTYYTMRGSGGLLIARYLPGLAGDSPDFPHLPSVSISGRIATWPAIYRSRVESANNDAFTERGIRSVAIDFDASDKLQSIQLGAALYIGGGMLHAYDGSDVVEAGFHDAPDDIEAPTQGAPTGDGVDIGTHSYRFSYEYTNGRGEIDIGPTSIGVEVVVADSAKSVTFEVPTDRLTRKGGVRIGVWRTLAGDAAAYYRVSSLDPSSPRYLANDVFADTVTFTDEMSDEDLEKQEPLYTNGGILSNDPIAGGQIIATGKDRIYTNDPSDPLVVRFTQQRREGYMAEFSPTLKTRLDPYGGDITGIVVMDDAVVVFKETAVFFFSGPGPLANPDAGGGFTEPQLITSDVGCINQRTIGYTPNGIIFRSQKGIFLLGRDRQVGYIGSPVEAFNGQTITSTDLIPDRTQIRLLTDAGRTLLYDYEHDQWSTFTNHEGVDAIVAGGTYHYLRSDGEVWRENAGHADVSRHIVSVIETAPLHYAQQLQGLERFYHVMILGEHLSDHILRTRIALDDRKGWEEPIDINFTDIIDIDEYGGGEFGAGPFGGAADDRYQAKIHIGRKGQSIRFRFEDVEPAGAAGASFELTELILTGGTIAKDAKLSASRMA